MRQCVFCGGPANSREHAWPDWVIALFRNQEEATIIAERDGEEPREWHGINVSVKVKRFCGGCNTGWMSDLENEARPLLLPLIRGERATLDNAQRIVVATWCLKTAMVFDLTRSDKNIAFLPSERAYLYEARGKRGLGSPFPPHTFIWLASYEGRFAMSAIASELRGLGDFSPTKLAQPIEANVVTLVAGAFVSQVLVARLPPEAESQPPRLHEGAAIWERACVQAWPLVGTSLSLPPALSLHDDDHPTLDDFAFRWPKVTSNPRRRRQLDAAGT
jgi:hypothetical protein